jgi:hypothetical protein
MSISPSALKVQQTLEKMGFTLQVVELPASTRTAVEAAGSGLPVEQIVDLDLCEARRPIW